MILEASAAFTGELTVNTFAGGAVNADALPTAVMVKNGTTDGAVVCTVANVTTGVYKVTGTLGAYTAGDRITLLATAVVGGLTFNENLWQGVVDPVAGATWDVAIAAHLAAGSTGLKLNSGGGAPTVVQIVNGVWDELIAGHLAAGSTGLKLNSAAAAGDPWGTALPGAYAAGTAGHLLGTDLPACCLTPASIADAVWDEGLVDHQTTGSAGKALSDAASGVTPTCSTGSSCDCTGPLGSYTL